MGDAYWNHRQAPMHPQAGPVKRPRTEFDLSSSGLTAVPETQSYLPRHDDRGGPNLKRDTGSLQSAYDRYLRSSHTSSEEGSRFGQIGLGRTVTSTSLVKPFEPELLSNGRDMAFRGLIPSDRVVRPRDTIPLPPDTSMTLYIEGLPSNCTKREVAHIFRPFVGYKEVRLVRKEPKNPGGEPIMLCFVDFADAACTATALSALQGYKMDEQDPDSPFLRLQFSKSPGPRSATRGRR